MWRNQIRHFLMLEKPAKI